MDPAWRFRIYAVANFRMQECIFASIFRAGFLKPALIILQKVLLKVMFYEAQPALIWLCAYFDEKQLWWIYLNSCSVFSEKFYAFRA